MPTEKEFRQPPRLALKLLTLMVKGDLIEEVEGDLEEKYLHLLKKGSRWRARMNYWYQVFNYLRPFALKRFRKSNRKTTGMFSNNLKVGWRQMMRQKMYSSIKVGGFALGIAASLLITLYIIDELSFDQQSKYADRTYRIYQTYQDERLYKWVWLQAPFAKVIKQDFPEIEMVGRYNNSELFGAGNGQFRRDDELDNTYEEGITYIDQDLLEMFGVKMVYGDIKHCLDEPNEIVLTKTKATKYFGDEDPIGRLMIWNNSESTPLKIGGVIEDLPTNSHFTGYSIFIGLASREMWKGESDYWGATNYPTYVRLREGTDPVAFGKKLFRTLENYAAPFERANGNTKFEDFLKKTGFVLQPLRDIHLYSSRDGIEAPVTNNGDIRFVWLFGAVAVFIVLIACVNFVNLSTAKSASRAKEVGLRKTVGSARGMIIRQFLIESLLYSAFSFAVGILIALLLLPAFNNLAGKTLEFPWSEGWFVPGIVISMLTIGLLAGIYPAFYLSSFRPAEVLKGAFTRGAKSSRMRSTLVVFQFTTSIVLIISTVVIYKQMSFLLNTEVGFDKEQVLLIQGTNTIEKQIPAFKEELLNLSDVKGVTVSGYLPIRGTRRNGNSFSNEGKRNIDRGAGGQFWVIDPDYANTLGLTVVDGRFFDKNMASDSNAVVINQKMVDELKIENPIGKKIENYRKWTIVGVVEDFHFESMRSRIEPLAMVIGNSPETIAIKLKSTDLPATLKAIDEIWKKFAPHQPIRTTFLDERFASMYDDVSRMRDVLTSFSVLAIAVACLGLFALSAYMVEQRGKEISIRLVLGAPLQNIFRLLTVNFLVLVLISIAIATPLAWYLMNQWLDTFIYKTSIGTGVFVIAGVIAVLVAMFTVSYQAIRAGLVNPADRLRTE